jgi:hypothetical protein
MVSLAFFAAMITQTLFSALSVTSASIILPET